MKFRVRASYEKSYKKLAPKLKEKVKQTLLLFADNPVHTILHNHALVGGWKGFRSLQVTGDYRIIFREISDGTYELVELVNVGTHSQLYG